MCILIVYTSKNIKTPKGDLTMMTLSNNPFAETRNIFRSYLEYSSPLSFEEWSQLAEDSKAAVLYVQFYEQITLAWYKAKSFYGDAEEGVETVIQYLMKNVPIIEEHPERFNANYIYRVSYNCLYCICHDRKCDKDRYEYECSNIVSSDDGDLDLFDTVPNKESPEDILLKEEMHKMIYQLSEDDQIVIEHIMYNDTKKLPKRLQGKQDEILENLKPLFEKFR